MDISDIRREIYQHIDEDAFLNLRMCCDKIKNELDNVISNEKKTMSAAFTIDLSFYNTNFTLACYVGCLIYAKLYHHIHLLPIKYDKDVCSELHNTYEHYINMAMHNACNQGQIEIIKWLMSLTDKHNNKFQIPLDTDKSILQSNWKIPRPDLMKMIMVNA